MNSSLKSRFILFVKRSQSLRWTFTCKNALCP